MHPLRRTAVALLALAATTLVASPGHAGEGVQKAQRRLNALGCNAGPADGTGGTWTRTAVIRFQAANHLAQTGRLSDRTRTRMYGDAPVRCDRRPVPRGSSGRRIVISQGQNYVWLVRADGSVVAQGGIVDNPRYLGTGTYASGSKCGRAAKIRNNTDASGRLRLHHFTRFAPCGIGFHQIPQYAPRSPRSTRTTCSAPTSVSRTAASGSPGGWPSGSGTSRRPAPRSS